ASLRQRHRETALSAIVRGSNEPGADGRSTGLLHRTLQPEIERRQPPGDTVVNHPEVFGATQADGVGTDQCDPIVTTFEPLRAPRVGLVQDPRHAYYRCGQDRLSQGFIVEGHVPSYHRDFQRATSLCDSLDCFLELPEDFRALGGAEIQAI